MQRLIPILGYLLMAILRAKATINVELQMKLGNPSGAMTVINNHNRYLIERTVEAIDYSDTLCEPVLGAVGSDT
jgi:hypothetical protein